MLEFLKRLTRATEEDVPAESNRATAISVHYQPELIEQLRREHQRLLELINEIRHAFELTNYVQLIEHLSELRTTLQAHLTIENVNLYSYLEFKLAESHANSDITRRFHREMDSIGIATLEFIRRYQNTGVIPELAPAFAREFSIIEKVLTDRIQKEEIILYPLYLP